MNIPLDNLSDMAVFTRVVELGHFSAAAREMHQTPSAVSRQIGRLERLLGMRLFERSTRKLRLTEAGAAVYEQCRSLVSAAREVVALRDSQQAVPHGLLRVSCPKAVARQILHPLMPAFLARYPEVDVQLIVTDRQVDLFEEAVDLAVRITEAPPAGLSGRPLMAVGHGVFATPRYLADKGTPAHPDELARHSCIYLGENESDRHWRFSRGQEQVRVRVAGRYVANHTEVRLEGALAHLGLASLPLFTARAACAAGELVQVLPHWTHHTDYAGTAWLLYPSRRFLPGKVRAWIDHVAAALAGDLPVP